MVISKKLENPRSQTQTHLRKIINVPLPSEHANIVLHDLQIRCNSTNKTIQIKALQCWGKWINDHNLNEWEADSICQFAVKPLVTKKLHPAHKDSDVSKLKLNLMWSLLSNVQAKMTLKGPEHILESFLQSCFTWLASIDYLENKVSVLILKLLLALFMKNNNIIECDNYIFVPIVIDIYILKKFLNNYIEKFLDLFDNWQKVQNNSLIKNLWECFLDHCEVSHDTIVTPIWHRVFKINQVFCSEKNNSIKERLSFLHICVTKIKTVLLSSKHMGGQSCFMTPCEALLKKLVEIGRADSEEVPSSEIFVLCEDISKILSFRSTAICDYDLCIYLLDALDDFSLKSCFWGSWCGLVDCFKKTFITVDIKQYTKNQMKFYRKLRAPTVNFELDKVCLTESCITKVYNNISILNICCFCSVQTSNSSSSISRSLDRDINISSLSTSLTKKTVENLEFDAASSQETMSRNNNSQNKHITPYCSVTRSTLPFNCGQFGSVSLHVKTHNLTLNIFKLDFDIIKNFYNAMDKNLMKLSMSGFCNKEFATLKCIKSTPTNFVETCKVSPLSRSFDKRNIKEIKKCHKKSSDLPSEIIKTSNKRRNNDIILMEECKKYLGKSKFINLTSRTRSKRKAEEQETQKENEEFSGKKKRKSFELLVQEIVKKNKLRKIEKNGCKKKLTSFNKRELRSRKKNEPVEEPKKQKTNNVKCLSGKRTHTSQKNEGDNKKLPRKIAKNGKLDKFFKVITPIIREKKKQTKCKKQLKLEKSNKKNRNKQTKGPNNWKQTFLKTVVKESSVEETKTEKSRENKKTSKKQKPPETEVDSKTGNNFTKSSKKLTKKQKRKKMKSTTGKINYENSVTLRNEAVAVEVARENKFIESPERVEDEHEIISKIFLVQSSEDEEKSNCNSFNEETEEKLNEPKETIFSTVEQKTPGDQHFSVNEINVTNSNEPEKDSELEKEKKTDEDEEILDERETREELFTGKKRVRTNDASDSTEIKKIKLDEDRFSPVRVTEKENLEILSEPKNDEFSSPIKSTAAIENPATASSPKFRKDSSPNGGSKSIMLSNSISSRALKMISLVPEYNKERYRPLWEISTRVEAKTNNNKMYPSLDRSSRVSKMLASLNKSMSRELEDSILEDKLTRKVLEAAPTCNLEHQRTSKSNKKRKFIGFDDTKNETIIFQIDTPPSRMLAEREMLKEKYASPERVLVVIS